MSQGIEMEDGNAKVNMSERRAASRKRDERDRMRGAGFKLVQVWVHEEDFAKVGRLVKKLRAARMGDDEE
jgi:hypothetical protein